MKKSKILIASLFLLLTSCSVKSKSSSVVATNTLESINVLPDSDFDGVPDEIELKLGTNPFVADIPKISIGLVQDVSIGAIFRLNKELLLGDYDFSILKQEFTETADQKGGDIDTLKVLRRKVVINQYNHLRNTKTEKLDIITNDDLRTNILSSWTDDQYFPFINKLPKLENSIDNNSGKFLTNFKIRLSNIKNVTEISDISLQSFFYDYEKMEETPIYDHFLLKSSGSKEKIKLDGSSSYSPVTIYPLIANEISSNTILEKILSRSEIGIKFTDYNYTYENIQLNYKQVLDNVFNGDAKIIFSTNSKTDVFFVSPGMTLLEVLKQNGKNVILTKDGDISSIDGIESTAKYPFDLDNQTQDDAQRGLWSVFGEEDSVLAKVKAQGIYVVSYSTIKDVLNNTKKWVELGTENFNTKLLIENVIEGDRLIINAGDVQKISIVESQSTNYTGDICSGSCTMSADPEIKHNGSCICRAGCTEVFSAVSQTSTPISFNTINYTKWLTFEDSYGRPVKASLHNFGNQIKVDFDSLKYNLKNKIYIIFRDPDQITSAARTGLISACYGGPSYSVTSFENQYILNSTIKVYGANKY
ncbi:MAG: hypothetical protein H7281_15140 [Bacteriovorax sp.]|nr:hypothetical protein [Bacteriovorax sp.]